MASAYISELDQEVTQEDLQNFYQNVGKQLINENDFDYDGSDVDDLDLNNLSEEDLSDDLEYQLELYNRGDINQLSKMQDKSIKSPKTNIKVNNQKTISSPIKVPKRKTLSNKNNITGPASKGGVKGTPNLGPNLGNPIDKETLEKINRIKEEINRGEQSEEDVSTLSHPFLGNIPVNNKNRDTSPQLGAKSKNISSRSPENSQFKIGSKDNDDKSGLNRPIDASSVGSTQISSAPLPDTKMGEMHQSMKDWLTMDDEIKEINKVLKVLKGKQKDLTQVLLKDMKNFQVGFLTEGSQQLKYQVSFPKQGYKKSYIQDRLTEYLKDSSLASKITEYLEESRPRGERVNLKRGKFDPLKEKKKKAK